MTTIRSSSADRAFSCHGSLTLSAKVEESSAGLGGEEGHAVTHAGTWCHAEAARRLITEFGAVGVAPDPTLPEGWTPSGYDEWVVEWYISRVLELTPRDHLLYVEWAIELPFPEWKLTGHIDAFTVSPDRSVAVINDLKRGFATVDQAESNWQLACYGVLLKFLIPELEKVVLRIHQPAAPDRTTEAVVDHLDSLTLAVREAGDAALNDPYTLATGKHCAYCPAALICPALRKEIMELKLSKEEVERLSAVPDVKELAEVVAVGRRVAYPIKRLTDALKERLAQSPGLTITTSDGATVRCEEAEGDRQITDRDYTFRALSSIVPPAIAIQAFKPSLASIEEILHTHAGLKKTSKKPDVPTCQSWVKENLGGVIVRPKEQSLVWQ